MCFLENKEEVFVNISSHTYYKLDFCVILNTKYLILNKNSNPKNLFSSPLILYQCTKFQCHNLFLSQDIKQNVLLGSYLDS